jgi:alpha-glucosidase
MKTILLRLFLCLCPLLVLLSAGSWASGFETTMKSPRDVHSAKLKVNDTGEISWSVFYKGKTILVESLLGFHIDKDTAYTKGFQLIREEEPKAVNTTWKSVVAERSEIPDRYHEYLFSFRNDTANVPRMNLIFRLYDEGAAYRYVFPKENNPETIVFSGEASEFAFTDDWLCWAVYSAQGEYQQVPLREVKPGCERPLLVEIPDGPSISIGEAGLVDFARMKFQPVPGKPNTLSAILDGSVKITTPYSTPWRFVMVADRPGRLVEHNYLLKNLNEPCAIEDTSWIKPGKVIREVTLTTDGGKACVDFAVERNIQYVEFDAGWYGYEYDDASDASFVSLDERRSKGPLDLQEVIRYADKKGIGVLLYVNRRALERRLDELLPLYQQWGVKGIKYGFVQVGSQEATSWLHEAVAKTAKYRMVVDVHDEYRTTGWERTYPNLLTVEGIRGNEEMPTAEHNCITALTRTLCGPGDYTHCWYTTRIKTTHAHQLASAIVFFSPLQFVYWYDRPQMHQGEPELDFWKTMPTIWDETRVLHDQVGNLVTLARRTGNEWYVGTLNAKQPRTIEIPTDFLEPGGKYTATIHTDAAPDGSKPFEVKSEKLTVDSRSKITVTMADNGGVAIHLVPQ